MDKPPKILSNKQLQSIAEVKNCPVFSRIPIFIVEVTKARIQKVYDRIPNSALLPLVNQKVVDLLLKIAPDEVQFFDTEIRCKDGVLKNYKIVNVIHTIKGIDHEKSVYDTMANCDAIGGFKYLTYLPGCMGNRKIARDEEYMGNILVTEEIKQAFEKEKIKGACFFRPEDYYRPLTQADLTPVDIVD
jgi:hypothetical protein